MTVFSFTVFAIIFSIMDTPRGKIIGVGIALTVLVWVIVLMMIRHMPSDSVTNTIANSNPSMTPTATSVSPISTPAPNSQLTSKSTSEHPQPERPHMNEEDKAKAPSINNSINNSPIINSPGSILAPGGTVYKTDIPEPKLTVNAVKENEPFGDQYKTEIMLTIDTKVPIPNLYLQVEARSITKMETTPQRAGVSMTGHSGIREGLAFTNLQQAYGSYRITVMTKNKEEFKVGYDYK